MCVAAADYHYKAAERGDILFLWCNSSKSSESKWTHHPPEVNRTYEYFNGSTGGRYGTEDRYSFVTSSSGVPGLKIYNAQAGDSGRFDCYEHGNVHRATYQLNVTGVLYISFFPQSVVLRKVSDKHSDATT